jgi:flavin-dependent dehydrogenase
MSGSGTAYVLGGSLAGLLSAAVLAERFDRVVVLERDRLPEGVRARRGVPQSRHLHALLSRGLTTLEELLPGFLAEMVHAGAVTGDLMEDVQWFVDGRPVSRRPAGIIGLSASRPLLEWMVRRRVAELPGVVIVPGCVVDGLLTTPDRRRVVGVRALADGQLREWTGADLVVDATGRATLSPRWLAELGFSVPVESQQIRLAYASRPYRRHGQDLGGRLGTASWAYPGQPYGGFVFAEEGDRCIMMVAAYSGSR